MPQRVTTQLMPPGFIDLHAHGQDLVSNQFQAADGVTTALDLEIGIYPIDEWYQSRQGKALINYGRSVAHPWVRAVALNATEEEAIITAAKKVLTDSEKKKMLALLRQGIKDGALGISVGIAYTPAADSEEIFNLFELAAELDRPIFVHMRNSNMTSGDLLAPLQELLSNAVATGAALHMVHLNSSLADKAKVGLDMIRRLQKKGFDITMKNWLYTATAGSTRLESALFDDWTDYAELQWIATGERLTETSFKKYRQQGGWVIIHNLWSIGRDERLVGRATKSYYCQ